MHKDLLNAYKRELRYLREVCEDFASAYPAVGSALSLKPGQNMDPMIQRLLEGFAFLTGRMAHRIATEDGRLRGDVLQSLMPDLLVPLPPTTMVEFCPVTTLSAGSSHVIPRGSQVRFLKPNGDDIYFKCCSDVVISPLKIRTLGTPGRSSLARLLEQVKESTILGKRSNYHTLRVEISALGNQSLVACLPEKLRMLCSGSQALEIWNILTSRVSALLLVDPRGGGFLYGIHPAHRLNPVGYEDQEAIIPSDCVLPGALRLLRELRHYPDKFNFVELADLQKSLINYGGDKVELWWLYDGDLALPDLMGKEVLRLHCAPIVNLFKSQCEPIIIKDTESEYRIRLRAHQAEQCAIVALDTVNYRDSLGKWRELYQLNSGFDKSVESRYALRVEPRWCAIRNQGEKRLDWDWNISPTTTTGSGQFSNQEILSITAWLSQRNVFDVLTGDSSNWRLDATLPVLNIREVGHVVQQSPIPEAKDYMPGAMGLRLDLLQRLPALEITNKIKGWLNQFGLDEYSSGIEMAAIATSIRRVPRIPTLVHARGWIVTLNIHQDLAMHPRLRQWLRLFTVAMGKQHQAESYIECRIVFERKQFAVEVVWL